MPRTARLVLIAALVAACGGGAPSSLDPAQTGPEGVPLPASAQSRAGVVDGYSVPGSTFAQVRGWYEAKLPAGQPLGGWA